MKHPRLYHLPWSSGTEDDRILPSADGFAGREVIVTEKLDGEQTTMYADHVHARAIDGRSHPSQSWVRQLHGQIGWQIPPGWRVCGENVYAQHSVQYDRLPTYFFVWAVYDERQRCLGWDDTVEWAALLGLTTVPVLHRGTYHEGLIRSLMPSASLYGPTREGYVVRLADGWLPKQQWCSVAKYVRPGHVQAAKHHWIAQPIVPNGLTNA